MTRAVFISHASKDQAFALGVCAALEQAKIRCWIAPRDLQPGKTWAGEIMRGIEECQVLVLVFTPRANASDHVLREVEQAADRGKHIVSFRIEESEIRPDLDYFLSIPHWLDALTPPIEIHHQKLVESIKVLLELPSAAFGEDAPVPTSIPNHGGNNVAASNGPDSTPSSMQKPARRILVILAFILTIAVVAVLSAKLAKQRGKDQLIELQRRGMEAKGMEAEVERSIERAMKERHLPPKDK